MFYIKDNNKIVLVDDSLEQLQNSLEFMPQYKDLPILETAKNEVIVDFKLMTVEEAKALEDKEEKERIAKLHLTKREVFLGLHKAKQVTPDMIKAQITDEEALIEFEYATEYYRGNPLIDMVGEKLNITPKQLDMFFETNNYLYLTDCTFTINPTPVEAKVIMNDVETKTMTVPFGNVIKYSVSQEGYKVNEGSFEAVVDLSLDIVLEKEEIENADTTDTTEPTIKQDEVSKESV